MRATPWKTVQQPVPTREYVALLSQLPLESFRALPAFLSYTREIEGQLKRAPGLIGYSMKARLLRKVFWTLSVWESVAALKAFVDEPPHGDVMAALRGKMGRTRFVQWRIAGFQCPPSWEHALKREEM